MIDALIDAAGITALTIAGGALLSSGARWYLDKKRPQQHVHMRVIPQIDGLKYELQCHTGRCDWTDSHTDLADARVAIHDHLVGHHGIQRPL